MKLSKLALTIFTLVSATVNASELTLIATESEAFGNCAWRMSQGFYVPRAQLLCEENTGFSLVGTYYANNPCNFALNETEDYSVVIEDSGACSLSVFRNPETTMVTIASDAVIAPNCAWQIEETTSNLQADVLRCDFSAESIAVRFTYNPDNALDITWACDLQLLEQSDLFPRFDIASFDRNSCEFVINGEIPR